MVMAIESLVMVLGRKKYIEAKAFLIRHWFMWVDPRNLFDN